MEKSIDARPLVVVATVQDGRVYTADEAAGATLLDDGQYSKEAA